MNLDDNAKNALQELGDAINSAVEKSPRVMEAIELLRECGFEPNFSLNLEIGLYRVEETAEPENDDPELDLTEDDLLTLRRMKIKL
jgi:hypothetical protein